MKHVTAIAGVRFDNNSNYQSAVSPKFSLSIKPSPKLHITASVGYGFKAPDFRQLYLNFTNAAAGGYSVLGTLEAKKQIATLQQQGLVESVTQDFYKLATLKPETSLGINAGVSYLPNNKTKLSINLFRNNLDNLIDYARVAYYKNGAQIFSYININKAFTQGLEFNGAHKITKNITVDAGYQLLFTGNQDEIDKIKQGLVFTRDKNGVARTMGLNEYIGLANRSNHTANFKLQYEQEHFYINLRTMYHSRWAINDKDGNGLYNTNDEFASEYMQLNATAGYSFKKSYSVQIGCNNITNYKDFTNLPSLMERNYFISFHYN
jgi:outer membrane receptor for ferrienterochelin and colicins